MQSGSLIKKKHSASIGNAYCAISKTSEYEVIFQKLTTAAALTVLLLAGCRKNSASTAAHSNKVRVGYIGLTCEAQIYTAYELGFFKEEVLKPELVKSNGATHKADLA